MTTFTTVMYEDGAARHFQVDDDVLAVNFMRHAQRYGQPRSNGLIFHGEDGGGIFIAGHVEHVTTGGTNPLDRAA